MASIYFFRHEIALPSYISYFARPIFFFDLVVIESIWYCATEDRLKHESSMTGWVKKMDAVGLCNLLT